MPGIDDVFAAENKEIAALTAEAQEKPSEAAPETPEAPEAPSEPAPAATQQAQEAPKAETERQPPRVVPLAEMLDERRRRQEAERRAAELEARFRAAQEPAKPKIPDATEDLPGHILAKMGEQERIIAELHEAQRQRMQHEQAALADTRFTGAYQAAAQEFAGKNADFMDAYRHLGEQREAELAALGFADPGERRARLEAEERMIVAKAFQDGVNPAERLYAIAKMRGFKKAPAVDGAEKLETVKRGQQAATSLSGAGGSGANGKISLEQLANMSETEFRKAMNGKDFADFA